MALGCYPDMELLARQAALDASGMLDASSYPTGHSPVVLDSRVMCELLDAFLPGREAGGNHRRGAGSD